MEKKLHWAEALNREVEGSELGCRTHGAEGVKLHTPALLGSPTALQEPQQATYQCSPSLSVQISHNEL